MVRTYNKGARAERELIGKFLDQGYKVIRAAGSGVNSLSPDILVFRKGYQYAFECKSWDKKYLNIKKEQFKTLKDWQDLTGITVMVAWKIKRKGWKFIPMSLFTESGKSHNVSIQKAELCMNFDDLIE